MNKFSKKIISLISSSLLSIASVSGVKGMRDRELRIRERIILRGDDANDEEAEEAEVEVFSGNADGLQRSQIFPKRNPPKLTFKLAREADRNTYLATREDIRANNGYNVLTEAPYNITNLVVNNPKKTAAAIVAAGALTWWLSSSNSSDTYDYEDEEDDYDNIK